jgi:hypothetical protein
MKNKLSLFILMLISTISAKAATLSETINGFFKPIVDNYLVKRVEVVILLQRLKKHKTHST